MKFTDLVGIIWNNMRRRKGRTILTMTGVIIGSIAILVIVSIGNGYQSLLLNELNTLGDTNTIYVTPYNVDSTQAMMTSGSVSNKKRKTVLNDKILKELKKQPFVKYCTPIITTAGTLQYKKVKKADTYIQGMEFKSYSKDHKLLYGKYPGDNSNECILGYQQAEQLINETNFMSVSDESLKTLLRKNIKIVEARTKDDGSIDTKEFTLKVSGIQNQSLGSISGGSSITAPLNVVKNMNDYLGGTANDIKTKGYPEINLVVAGSNYMSQAEQYLKSNGYMYTSIKDLQSQVGNVIGVLKLVLGALAGISLFVAAFGIANTMNMAIYERKKEIGVMKVVGAGVGDVKKIFIGEASAIGLSGGVVGILLGTCINYLINAIMSGQLSKSGAGGKLAVLSLGLVVFVLVFSTLVGFVSGLIPASRAAKLNVIDSIKDE